MAETGHLTGTVWKSSRVRAGVEPSGSGNTFLNAGPDSVNHSATADMASPTAVAAGALSGTISTRRFLEAVGVTGHATITANGNYPTGNSLALMNDPRNLA